MLRSVVQHVLSMFVPTFIWMSCSAAMRRRDTCRAASAAGMRNGPSRDALGVREGNRHGGTSQRACYPGFRQPTARTVREGRLELLADVETANDVEVTLRIDLFQVIQQATPAADQHQQAAPAGEIPLVTLQMLGQSVDPRRQNGNLDFGRARVVVARWNSPISPVFRSLVIVICYRDCSTLFGSGCFHGKQTPPTALETTLPTKCFTKLLSS